MLVIDAHMHVEHEDPNIIYAMEVEAGVDRAIVWSIWNPSRESNDLTLKAYERYPNFFVPFGHVRPSDPYWREELRRIAGDLGWSGLKLHIGEFTVSHAQRINDLSYRYFRGVDVEALFEVVGEAQDHDLIVVIDVSGRYDIAEELARRFRRKPIIIPHLGGDIRLLESFCKLARSYEHIYLDTSFIHVYRVVSEAVTLAGADKLIWGSDGYWMHPLVELTKIRVLKLRREDEEKILGGNVSRILEG
ncbi:MAG: amidohydrolase family protein [Nitrososphaerota archaeon]|nr:amidohydrolase family protein [Candidatus Bathyarchaeota archaeon]MCX8161533.1 amidohydrolase family protein [Candidatus Bathyarchaeota archaeon]MDW8062277.1 amidohydrolase family protein [Nitrososphaerota archaeon]